LPLLFAGAAGFRSDLKIAEGGRGEFFSLLKPFDSRPIQDRTVKPTIHQLYDFPRLGGSTASSLPAVFYFSVFRTKL